jgi:hypothetical protein
MDSLSERKKTQLSNLFLRSSWRFRIRFADTVLVGEHTTRQEIRDRAARSIRKERKYWGAVGTGIVGLVESAERERKA